jgi:Protein of unknown function (DUF2442)
MYWDVTEIKVNKHLVLEVHFVDGVNGIVKFLPEHLTGVFTVLKDPLFFEKAYVEDGVVTWPGELDLAPDAMYEEIKKNGEWVLA